MGGGLDRSAEQRLVCRVRGGERETCALLVREHHAAVYRLLLHLSRDAHLAEDLTQETFAAAWAHIGSFNGESALGTWLHRIACRKFADAVRSGLARRRESGASDAVDGVRSPNRGPLEAAVADEQERRLMRAVDALDDADRELVVLHYFQGLSFREMAQVLGRPAGTVKWRVSETLARLRELIDAGTRDQPDDGAARRPRGATPAASAAGGAGGA